jgi:hypothetical protein
LALVLYNLRPLAEAKDIYLRVLGAGVEAAYRKAMVDEPSLAALRILCCGEASDSRRSRS